MATRKELKAAIGERYRAAAGRERRQILEEFVRVTGYHRKHALRVLNRTPSSASSRSRHRLYDEATLQALKVLWEAADRICGKRLKALIPVLVEAMERRGYLQLDAAVKTRLLNISAATIDRRLEPVRRASGPARRRRWGVGSAIKQSVPVRTFADWGEPPPGNCEADLVEHCGGAKEGGNYVHSLTLTDIHSGWTECAALVVREQSLVVHGIDAIAQRLPFALRGLDTDNDSAFMNETLQAYCREHQLEWTRSRAYCKNDQAWVEQKNGAVVRRLAGYERLSGIKAAACIARLYDSARLYVNFFQPSFKLAGKQRDGALIRKHYHPPRTPYQRLLASDLRWVNQPNSGCGSSSLPSIRWRCSKRSATRSRSLRQSAMATPCPPHQLTSPCFSIASPARGETNIHRAANGGETQPASTGGAPGSIHSLIAGPWWKTGWLPNPTLLLRNCWCA
jgi:hypothetical protein